MSQHELKTNPVRLGCVGLGDVFGGAHLPVLQDERRVEVVAVADVNEEALAQATELHRCAGTADWRELLTESDIEAQLICTLITCTANPQ